MLSKTSLNKMKKDELVEYILKGQEKAGRDALFAEEDENAELKRRNKNIEWEVDDAERRASGILSYWSNENKILKEGLTSNLSEYNTLKQKYDALDEEFKWRLTDECEVAIVDIAFDEQWEVVKRRTHVDLLHRSCVEIEALKEQIKELKDETELNAKRDLHHQLILYNYFHKKTDNVEGITFNQEIVNYCETLKEQNEELRENEEGIMEYKDCPYCVQGCNSYERFINLSAELDYDEKWIGEMKEEIDAMVENQDALLRRLREYMGRIGGDCVEVFDKMVDDWADEEDED